ncbi:MAG: ROK family transcriptional regulator [Oscillospiraceae bacterium]|nr:ROK family transcriptional regulator [Oscillospiraceae bacterium]
MKEKAATNKTDMKYRNRGLLLKLVATGQATTRVDLARSMGLSKMAITNAVNEMVEAGLLINDKTSSAVQPGRIPITLKIAEHAPKVLGVLIGREHCEATVCDLTSRILYRETVQMQADMTKEKLYILVFQLIDTLLARCEDPVIAIGVASIGPVSVRSGMILKPYYFYDIENVEIVKVIEERYNLPVYFENDNQSAVLAESLFGVGRGYRDILYVGVGNGIGCGIISNGESFDNAKGLPSELGHVSIDKNGPECPCGNRGCVETYVRTPELLKKLRYYTGKYYTYDVFCRMKGVPEVENTFMDAANNLSAALINVINILNSELIILGNSGSLWDDRYIAALEDAVNRKRFARWETPVLVKRPHFLKDAAVIGAACNAINAVFKGELIPRGLESLEQED